MRLHDEDQINGLSEVDRIEQDETHVCITVLPHVLPGFCDCCLHISSCLQWLLVFQDVPSFSDVMLVSFTTAQELPHHTGIESRHHW